MKAVEVVYRYDAGQAPRPRPVDADAAQRRLDEGSRAFAQLLSDPQTTRRVIEVDPRDLGLSVESGAAEQHPFAAVLGCSDARVPIELIFNEGPNDLFVVRVAGNGLGAEGLGSLKYAADHLGDSLKLIVVLGHSGCGAATSAVDVFLNPRSYLELAGNHMVRNILDRLLVVVHAVARVMVMAHGTDVSGRPGYREALIESAVACNAALAVFTIGHELSRTSSGAALRAVFGVWLLESRQIWAPRADSAECASLAPPPADVDASGRFVNAVVRSARIEAILAR
jgi:carbonic anhydrase